MEQPKEDAAPGAKEEDASQKPEAQKVGQLHLKKSLEEETGALRNLCAFNELINSLPCCKADRDDMSNIVCDSYLWYNSPRN